MYSIKLFFQLLFKHVTYKNGKRKHLLIQAQLNT
jgi:hypothetical protein